MTTITRLTSPAGAEKKKIEFNSALDKNFTPTIVTAKESNYEKITLLVSSYMGGFDLMLAEGYGCKHLFIGHFNDGVV